MWIKGHESKALQHFQILCLLLIPKEWTWRWIRTWQTIGKIMNVSQQLVFVKQALISVCVIWGGFLSLHRINANPLNATAHLCICGQHRHTAAGPYKEIRCQKSWMTLFCCQFITGFVDNFLLSTWQWRWKGKSDTHTQTKTVMVQMLELDSVHTVKLHFWAQAIVLLFIIVMAEKSTVNAYISSDGWLIFFPCWSIVNSSMNILHPNDGKFKFPVIQKI